MKVVSVVGARPQFIKAATVSRELRRLAVPEVLIHTGQHYDQNMSDIFFEELDIPDPDCHLGIGSGSHGAQTGRMLEALEQEMLKVQPDWVLVYGDTNSTLAAALAAVKLHVPVAHVEAGLRSFNRRMPEEINRVLTDHASDVLFAPTKAAVENLRQEGISERKTHLVGDVMYDAALYYGGKADMASHILERLQLQPKGYILATVHRAENTDDPALLHAIFNGLYRITSELPVVLPLHPRTRAALDRAGLLAEATRSLRLIEPVGYLDMVMLEKNARLIATDSGGVQKEAFFYEVPCVTLRGETEWVELVELGWNQLVLPDSQAAVEAALRVGLTELRGAEAQPYGDGGAATQIAQLLADAK